MKYIAILSCLFVLAQDKGSNGKTLQEMENKCSQDLHLNGTEMQGNKNLQILGENSKDYGEWLNCIWKEMRFQNDDGSINEENIKMMILEKFENKENVYVSHALKLVSHIMVEDCIQNQNLNLSATTLIKVQDCMTAYIQNLEKMMY